MKDRFRLLFQLHQTFSKLGVLSTYPEGPWLCCLRVVVFEDKNQKNSSNGENKPLFMHNFKNLSKKQLLNFINENIEFDEEDGY